jgi:DNA-binding transcriptional regulator GbsR (MarR family)
MEESERVKKQKELVEYIGRQNERDGFQPVTARILGLLMVMDKEEFTFDEIVEEMKISKSSASTALKNLEIRGIIEYVTYAGDRKRYFRFHTDRVDDNIENLEKKLQQNLNVVHQIIELKKDKNSRNAIFLKKVATGMETFIKRIDEFRAEFESGQ